MSFGEVSDLYVIGRHLFSSFFTENFKNTDVYKDYILNQTFNREIKSGALDLSGFTSTSETYTVTDLTFKLTPRNSSDIDIELKYSGKITFKKDSSSDSHYSSFSTAYLDANENEVSSPLTATIQITDTRNGGNSVLTDLFTFGNAIVDDVSKDVETVTKTITSTFDTIKGWIIT